MQKLIYQVFGQLQVFGVFGMLLVGDSSVVGGFICFLLIIGVFIFVVILLLCEFVINVFVCGIFIKLLFDNLVEYMLKGYFLVFDDGGGMMIIYVWDVLDVFGVCFICLQGQEKFVGKFVDFWVNVLFNVMFKIVLDMINMYFVWKLG